MSLTSYRAAPPRAKQKRDDQFAGAAFGIFAIMNMFEALSLFNKFQRNNYLDFADLAATYSSTP